MSTPSTAAAPSLAAATRAAGFGLSVVVLDEQPAPGGQIYRASDQPKTPQLKAALGTTYPRGGELLAAFRASSARLLPGRQVCQIETSNTLYASDGQRLSRIDYRKLLVAVGALERPVPIPGWTLPGVMGVGAAQTLLKTGGLVPDADVWVAGSGPLALLYLAQLQRAGCRVAGFLDTATRANRLAALRHLPGALAGHAELRQGISYLRALRASGLRHETGIEAIEAIGESRLTAIRFRRRGRWQHVPAGGLLLHEGVVPNSHVTMALRCRHAWHPQQLCFRPVLDDWGRTDAADVLVAGDCGGIAGAAAAEPQGELAALAAATDLGRITASAAAGHAAPLRRRLARALAIRPFLDALYRPRAELRVPADDVVVCRCEAVTAGTVRAAVAAGCAGPDAVKSLVRCGMGPCQGRECGLTLTTLIADATGKTPEEIGFFRIRPPLKQLRLAELADLLQPESVA